ncbi:MAG: hypothetical protein ACLTSZ_08205 [Lachnospiraceae bacterium]
MTAQQNDTYKQQLVVAMSSGKAPNMYIHWGGGPMVEYYKVRFVILRICSALRVGLH